MSSDICTQFYWARTNSASVGSQWLLWSLLADIPQCLTLWHHRIQSNWAYWINLSWDFPLQIYQLEDPTRKAKMLAPMWKMWSAALVFSGAFISQNCESILKEVSNVSSTNSITNGTLGVLSSLCRVHCDRWGLIRDQKCSQIHETHHRARRPARPILLSMMGQVGQSLLSKMSTSQNLPWSFNLLYLEGVRCNSKWDQK